MNENRKKVHSFRLSADTFAKFKEIQFEQGGSVEAAFRACIGAYMVQREKELFEKKRRIFEWFQIERAGWNDD